MKNISLIISIILIIFMSCENPHRKRFIKESSINILKNKYENNVLNYFHEVIFFNEQNRENTFLKKWKSDIYFVILGNPSKEDIIYVENSAQKINNLNLPIKLYLTNDIEKSNVKIYFGNKEELDPIFHLSYGILGVANTISTHGIINEGKIGILNSSNRNRESLILEEMTQLMGSLSDSYSYPNSIHFQASNNPLDFSLLDKKVLQLLYEEAMPEYLSLVEFEDAFKNELVLVNTLEKLCFSLKKEKIKRSMLEMIDETCFIDGQFYKHPKTVEVFIYGFSSKDSIFISKGIESINTISENLTLRLSEKNITSPDAGITIALNKVENQEFPTQTKIETGKGIMFKPKRYKSDITINFKSISKIQEKKEKVILKSLYKSLGPINIGKFDDDWYNTKSNKILIKEEYKQLLKIIYQDIFVDGIEQEEFNKLINRCK